MHTDTDARLVLEPSQPVIDRFITHLPNSGDEALIVVKGHVLAEELLDDIIRPFLHAHEKLINDHEHLQFSLKTKIAHALTDFVQSSEAWVAVRKLNDLRNKLVHKIEHPAAQRARDDFIRYMVHYADKAPGFEPIKTASGPQQLALAIVGVLSLLHGFSIAATAIEIRAPRLPSGKSIWTGEMPTE